jgi:membrane protease YdiL (CAAX protease family)
MRHSPNPAAMRHELAAARCPWCGYSLQGLTADVCPECGRPLSGLIVEDPRQATSLTIATTPDAGTPARARIFAILAVILIGLVALLQQLTTSTAAKAAGQPPTAPAGGMVPAAPIEFEITAKVFVKLHYAALAENPGRDPGLAPAALNNLEQTHTVPADSLRTAIVAAAMGRTDRAVETLRKLADPAPESDPLAADARALLDVYEHGAPLEPDIATRLIDRYDWFGRLAATHGLDPKDPARAAIVGGGGRLLAGLAFAVLLLSALLIAGFVLFIVMLVRALSGTLRIRFIPPLPGGSIAIETVCIFVACFIGLKVLAGALAAVIGEQRTIWIALGAQWLLILVILYPVLRGVPRANWLARVGLYRGEGVLKEIGAGIVGYLACLPLLIAGVITSVTLVIIERAVRSALFPGARPALPENPIVDLVGKGSPLLVAIFFLLASLWAPLVEESIFRGSLYRSLRSGWHWFPAGLVTALAFGLMHGYPVLLLGPVIALGFGFALIREWRGSLIASMTGHCLHNATALTLIISIFKLAGM